MSESTIWEYFNFNTGDIFINIGIVFIIAGIALMIFIRKNIVFKNIKLFSRANIFLGVVFFIIGIISLVTSWNLDFYKCAIFIEFSVLLCSLEIMYFVYLLLKKYNCKKIKVVFFIIILIFIVVYVMPILDLIYYSIL